MELDSAIFYSHDITKVIPFYVETLQFTLESQSDRFVSFIFPGGGRLGIKNQTEERELPGFQTVFVSVNNIETIYSDLQQRGVSIYKELSEKAWGWEFSILDPDSNKVLFIKR